MLKIGSINMNATSRIGKDDIVYFNASFSSANTGNYSVSKNIANIREYQNNKEKCDNDGYLFEERAREMAEKMMLVLEEEETNE